MDDSTPETGADQEPGAVNAVVASPEPPPVYCYFWGINLTGMGTVPVLSIP